MSEKEKFVLDCLSDGAWWFGLDLIEKSKGLLARGTIYLTLERMEDKGLIEGHTPAQGDDRRRRYKLK